MLCAFVSCACLLFWLNYALYSFFSLSSTLIEWMRCTAFPVFWIIKCLISFFRWKKERWWDCKRKVLYYSNSYLKKTGIRKFLTIKRPFAWLEAGKSREGQYSHLQAHIEPWNDWRHNSLPCLLLELPQGSYGLVWAFISSRWMLQDIVKLSESSFS